MFRYAVCLSALLVAAPSLADDFKTDRIVLSSGGLAEISATLPVSGRTTISFDVPKRQIDDILKSLTVQGVGIRVVSVDLAGREPLSETFAELPFQPDDFDSSATLLSALKGVEVEVQRNDRTLRGVVIGVEPVAAVDGAEASAIEQDSEAAIPPPSARSTTARLSIASEESSIEYIDVDVATHLKILDQSTQAALLDSLKAIALNRSTDRRTVAITLEGPPSARATITYVIGAPVWKPVWRLVLPASQDSAKLQGWAVFENRTGRDWKDVVLTLSSGTPVAFRQALYDSVTIPRVEIPLRVGQRFRPTTDEGVLRSDKSVDQLKGVPETRMLRKGIADEEGEPEMAGPESSEPVVLQPEIRTTEGIAASTFEIQGRIDLEDGRSVTLPFFSGNAVASRVSVYQPDVSAVHPIAAVRIKNDSQVTLPGGIVTVYEQPQTPHGEDWAQFALDFVGDADLSTLAPGEERLLAFALDPKIRVSSDASAQKVIKLARVENGMLVVDYQRIQQTNYRLEGDPNADRAVLIEHRANTGWTIETPATVIGRDGDRVRLSVDLKAGETRKVDVTETSTIAQRWSLHELSNQLIVDVLAVGGSIDPKLGEKLRQMVAIRTELAALEQKIQSVDAAIDRIREDQERVRKNLAAVDKGGDLARTYLDLLQKQEATMGRLEAERGDADAGRAAAAEKLSDLIASLSL
jgi:hypothetical protein